MSSVSPAPLSGAGVRERAKAFDASGKGRAPRGPLRSRLPERLDEAKPRPIRSPGAARGGRGGCEFPRSSQSAGGRPGGRASGHPRQGRPPADRRRSIGGRESGSGALRGEAPGLKPGARRRLETDGDARKRYDHRLVRGPASVIAREVPAPLAAAAEAGERAAAAGPAGSSGRPGRGRNRSLPEGGLAPAHLPNLASPSPAPARHTLDIPHGALRR